MTDSIDATVQGKHNTSFDVLQSFSKCNIDLDRDLQHYSVPSSDENKFYNRDVESKWLDPFEYENW